MIAFTGAYCPYVHCGDDRPRPGPWTMPQRRLSHWLLVTSLAGQEQLRVAGENIVVPAGSSYLLQPDVLADLGSRDGNTPVWIHFDLRFDHRRASHPYAGMYQSELGERASFLQPDARAVFGVDLPVLVPRALNPLFREGVRNVVRTWQQGGPLAQLQAAHLLAGLLLAWVARELPLHGGAPTLTPAARLDRAEALAREHLATGFDVDDFAAASGYSRSRFCAVYQELRRTSPGAWLRGERLRVAEDLLARDDLPIARVGAMVGYPDATVFGRVFRVHAGVSPGEWRRRR